jgi:hypothetical protein
MYIGGALQNIQGLADQYFDLVEAAEYCHNNVPADAHAYFVVGRGQRQR